jgi:hypothetical protein
MSVVDSQPKTQRSGREKRSVTHHFKPQLFNRDWLEVRENGESSLFYSGNPKSLYPSKAASARRMSMRVRATSTQARVHAGPRLHHVDAGAGLCVPSPAQTHLLIHAVKTRPRGKCGRERMSGRNGRPEGHFYTETSIMTTLCPTSRNPIESPQKPSELSTRTGTQTRIGSCCPLESCPAVGKAFSEGAHSGLEHPWLPVWKNCIVTSLTSASQRKEITGALQTMPLSFSLLVSQDGGCSSLGSI